jgi:hypothetical protein
MILRSGIGTLQRNPQVLYMRGNDFANRRESSRSPGERERERERVSFLDGINYLPTQVQL